MEQEIFKFYSQGRMKFTEAKLKGGVKKYYIEGYASTVEKDLAGEVISDSAQDSMMKQFRNRNITIDVEHEEWYDDNGNQLNKPKSSMIPVAKVISAKKDSKGTWVKAQLNDNIERFKEIWGSITDGFLNAFSIGFFPVAQNGNVITDLNIVNLTLTGTPVNPGATFTPVLKSAVAYLKSNTKENVQMETKIEAPVEVAPVEAPVVEAVAEAPKVEAEPLKTEAEIKKEEAPVEKEAVVEKQAVEQPTEVKETSQLPDVSESKQEDISVTIDRILAEKLVEFEKKLTGKAVEDKIDTKVVAEAVKVDVVAEVEAIEKPISPLGMIKAIQIRKSQLGNVPKLKALVEELEVESEDVKTNKQKSPLQLV